MPPTVVIPILFLFGLSRESCGKKPLLLPKKSEVLIDAGDSIEFECIDSRKIFFFSPTYYPEHGQKIISSLPQTAEYKEHERYKYAFSRRNATPTDTGWYGCANRDVTVILDVEYFSKDNIHNTLENFNKTLPPPIYEKTEVRWIYYYVTSPNSAFVEEDEKRTIIGIATFPTILPCRPTRPDLEVVLYNEVTKEVIEIGENVSYDPKLGFIFNYCTEKDSGHYSCHIKRNDVRHKINYHLHVRHLRYIKSQQLNRKTYCRASHGETAVFNVSFEANPKLELIWLHSSGDQIMAYRSNSSHMKPKYAIDESSWFANLTIYRLDTSDEGVYKLQATSAKLRTVLNFTLEVSDKPYVMITTDEEFYTLGQPVEFKCDVTATRLPNITWSFRPFYLFKKNTDAMVSRVIRGIYKIMLRCWNAKSMLRPSFTELVDCIGNLLEENVKVHYISLNSSYIDTNKAISGGKIDYLRMVTSPDHATLSSFERNYVDSPNTSARCTSAKNPTDESDVCSLRPNSENSCFEFSSTTLDSEDSVELLPLRRLKSEKNISLKSINTRVKA